MDNYNKEKLKKSCGEVDNGILRRRMRSIDHKGTPLNL